ncbi:unnamed protein product [Polarella glacialis]|uniref:ADP-ribosylhydrolase ARH3 n=2 Tax=Polarella glacialis TaxID=89957 RepID=A0A813HEH8_POLGL|nr:unnamed protein product [Polarella glacialis]CAE8743254.1 unnamed protein product [Polarella glacialis]
MGRSLGREDDLNGYSILSGVSLERKLLLVEAAARDDLLNRAMGCMQGMAVGDALGHPFEFQPAQDTPTGTYFDLATLKFHGESNAFRLERGQWTDDAAMGLCMADSLIIRRCFDGSDMRARFWCWWNRGYNNAFRKDPRRTSSVGLGGNIAKSLTDISYLKPGEKIPPAYGADGEDAGNGSLMRFAPVAVAHHSATVDQVLEVARMSSYTTHPGIIAAEACSLLAFLIVRALHLGPGEPKSAKQFLEKATSEYLDCSGLSKKSGWGYDQMKWLVKSQPVSATERCWNWKCANLDIAGTLRARGRTYNGYPVSAGYFGSYSLDGLAMALWAVYHTSSFDEAVVKSVNLLGDADSHGSICGQLAGAIYGYSSINPGFIKWVSKWDDHECAVRGVLLAKIGGAGIVERL